LEQLESLAEALLDFQGADDHTTCLVRRNAEKALKAQLFRDQSLAAGAALLPEFDTYVIETAQLPLVHHDPFDRLLIAQVIRWAMAGLRRVAASRLCSTPNDGVF
jgi:hypothetical protein